MQTKKANKKPVDISHLASFPELNPNPVIEINMSGNVTYANPAVLKLFSDYKKINFKTHYLEGIPKIVEELTGAGEISRTRELRIGHLWHLQMIHYVKKSGSIRIYGYDITKIKRNDEKIKENEAILKIISKSSPIGIVLIGPDRINRWSSESMLSINGYGFEEMIGKSSRKLYLTNKEFTRVGKVIFDEINRGGIGSTDTQWVHKDGRVLDIHIEAAAIDPEDLSAGIILTGIDITERKQIEEAHYRSKQMLQLVLDNIPQRVFWKDLNLQYLGCNKAFAEDTRLNPGDLIGKKDSQLRWKFLAEEHEKDEKFVTEQEAYILNHEERVEHSDGSITWLRTNKLPLYDRKGKVFGILGTYEDITLNREADQKVRESEERYRTVIESSNDGVAITKKGKHIYVNPRYLEIFGFEKPEDIIGKSISCTVHPDDYQKIISDVKLDSTGKKSIRNEFKGIKKDGTIISILNFSTTINEQDNQTIISFLQDITERKEAERILMESEEKFRTFFDKSMDGILLTTSDGSTFAANPAACQMLGRTEEEICGLGRGEIIAEENTHMKDFFEQRTKKGYYRGELLYVHRDGTRIPCDVSSAFFKDRHGNDLSINILRDIRERKQSEEALIKSEHALRLISDHVIDVVWSSDLKGNFTFVTPSAERLWGYTTTELLATIKYHEIMTAESRQKVLNLFLKELENETHKSETAEVEHICKGGEKKWCEVTVSFAFDQDNHPIGIIGVTRDISERKLIERALRESEKQLQALMDNAPVAVTWTDVLGNYKYMNHKFSELFGYTIDDVPTMREWTKRSHPDPASLEKYLIQVNQQTLRLSQGYSPLPIETEITCKDGAICNVSVLGAVVSNNYMIIYIDITEHKRMEQELAKRADALARSNAELEQFAYIASHDLQEPLRMVASYTELLGHRYAGKLDKDADEFIFFAVDGVNRMKRLINDLLLYSRVGSKGRPFRLVDCNEAFKQAVINLTMFIKNQHAVVTADSLPEVMADDVQLVQLLQNLIGNAIKFHGTLPPCIHVSVKQTNTEWIFSVKDNGIGIEPKYFERIFVIFQRLHRKEEYSGTGVGLAVCKRIVVRHGGRIWVESEFGKGSEFHFTIPVRGEE